ncbi:hypothetical protein METHB2_970002 [Candidatus Methylobacter favarea]|uniref:Uncharacterized protein n=1 Tax=Candidatus Methylobacter favarea TaxID=2707345 RepID=A0A8S0Y774_9GAMM|nr:hypothetical protein [Candidatus Methylobacter favarea]CAA9893049.1 hypothetical protein METHB2_970002 [Candidatus Methylobacter favarea]
MVADGVLSGTVQGKTFSTNVSVPVNVGKTPVTASAGGITTQQVGCDILNLDIGAIDLNLLGLEIHIDPISIDVEADPTGGLVGQLLSGLLCNLLPNLDLTNITAVVAFLLQLLAILG